MTAPRLASYIATVALVVLAGCPSDPDFIECRDNTSCDRFGGGTCLVNPETDNQFCAYPDGACASGMRWSDHDVEGGISGACVEEVVPIPDAGVGDGMLDTTAPMVLLTSPTNTESGVATAINITAMFDESIDPATVTTTSFVVREGSATIAGSLRVEGDAVIFQSSGSLNPNAQHTVTIGDVVADLAGNTLGSSYTWSFTTRQGGWSTPALLEQDNAKQASDLIVDFNGSGSGVAAWIMHPCSGATCEATGELWAAIYSAGTWSAAERIVTTTSSISTPAVVMDETGIATLVWGEKLTSFWSLLASRYTPGTDWSANVEVETSDLGSIGLGLLGPRIDADANGNVVVAFSQQPSSLGVPNLWAARYVVGTSWASPVPVESVSGSVYLAGLAVAPNGTAVAIWEQPSGTVLASRFNATNWSAPAQLRTSSQGSGVVRAAPDSTFLVVFKTGAELWSARYTSSWSAAAAIDASTENVQFGHDLAFDATGRAIAVWPQGATADAWHNLFDPTSEWGTASRIEQSPGAASYAKVAFGVGGRAMAVWRQPSGGSVTSLWSSSFVDATAWGAPGLVEGNDAGNAELPHVFYDNDTNVFGAVWIQTVTAYPSVYTSKFE